MFSEVPGISNVGECEIVVEAGSGVVNLPPRPIPFRLRDEVAKEIEKLKAAGAITSSNSE